MKIQILLCLLVCAVLISYSDGKRLPSRRNPTGLVSLTKLFRGGNTEQGLTNQRNRNFGSRSRGPQGQTTAATLANEQTKTELDTSSEWWEDDFNSTDSEEEKFDDYSWLESLEIFENPSDQRELEKKGGNNGRGDHNRNKVFRELGQMNGFSQHSRGIGKKGRAGRPYSHNSSVEETTPSWCLSYCYKWIGKIGNFEQVFPTLKMPNFFKKKAIKSFCQMASEQLCSSNGTLPSNLTVTVDPTENSTELTSCLSGDDCEMNECCVIGRSGMRCEKLNSLGDTCKRLRANENATDVYLSKCPCAVGLECQLNQSQKLRSRHGKRERFMGQCVKSDITPTILPEVTTFKAIAPPVPKPANISCVEHMDCPYPRCCTYSVEGDKSSGVCKGFSVGGATCSTPETYLEFSKVGACPCQVPFFQCQPSTEVSADPTINGICKPSFSS